MDLDALLRPRGPLPPAVYWRRRLVLVLILALLGWLLSRGGGDGRPAADRGPAPTSTPSASPRPSPRPSGSPAPTPTPAPATPSPSRTPGGPCRSGELRIEALSDARSYAAGARPVLTLAVTNAGPVACTRDLGQAARELRVRSGSDRIWSSDDCAPGGAPDVVTLRPGERRTFSVTWSRRRSRPDCPPDQPFASPGTYQLVARLGELTATSRGFVLAG